MTTEELQKAYTQQQREIVGNKLGQVALRPTISQGGQYNVAVQATPKENSFTQISKALSQFPQIAGQFKNIQQQAGVDKVQAMDPNEIKAELQRRAETGDEGAKGFIYDLFQKEAVDEEIYRQVLQLEVLPSMQSLESELANASPNLMNEILSTEDPIADIESRYLNAVPEEVAEMVANSPHQKALHNEMLRRIPLLAGTSHAKLIENRGSFNDSTARAKNISLGGDPFAQTNGSEELPSDPDAFVDSYNVEGLAGDSILPQRDFTTEPKDPSLNPEERPVLPRAEPPKAEFKSATVSSFPVKPGSDDNTMEDYVKGIVDFVTVMGNPSQQNKEIILDSVNFLDEKGESQTIENVPVVVKGGSKTTANGVFSLATDGKSQDIKGSKFVSSDSPKDPTVTAKAIKLNPKEEVQLVAATLKKEREDFAENIAYTDSLRVKGGIKDIGIGAMKKLDEPQWRKIVQEESLTAIQANIQENLNVADTFLEGIRSGKLKLNGKPYSNEYIARLQRMVDLEEKRQDSTEDSLGEEVADEELKKISTILINEEQIPTDQRIEKLSERIRHAEKLYTTGQIGKPERDEITAEADRSLQILQRYGDDTGVDFYVNSANTKPIMDALGQQQALRNYGNPDALVDEWKKLGRDVTDLTVTAGDDLDERKKWNEILFRAHVDAADIANDKATKDVINEYKKAGKKDTVSFDVTRMVDGKEEVISIKDYYKERMQFHFSEAAGEVADTTIEELKRRKSVLRGIVPESTLSNLAGVTSNDTPEVARQKMLEMLEEDKGDTDFLSKTGEIESRGFMGNKQKFLERFNKTASDPDARKLLIQSNSLPKRQRAIEEIVKSATPKYYASQRDLVTTARNNKDYQKELALRAEIIQRSQYIGIPMELHRDDAKVRSGTSVRPIVPYVNIPMPKLSSYALDLNPTGRDPKGEALPPLYSRKVTSKTYVYNYNAAREGAEGNYKLLDELHTLYFPKDKDSLSLEDFRKNQIDLAREVGFGRPATETLTK